MNSNATTLERTNSGSQEFSVNAILLNKRCILLEGEVTDEMAARFTWQVLYLTDADEGKPIRVFISSNGGSIEASMAIYDVVQTSKAPIEMYCLGKAYSMAAVIFASGLHGRYMLPHSRLMLHEPLIQSGIGGKTSSIQSVASDMLRTKKQLEEILVKHTGQTLRKLDKVMKEDTFFTAEEAVAFGLADGIKGISEMMGGND